MQGVRLALSLLKQELLNGLMAKLSSQVNFLAYGTATDSVNLALDLAALAKIAGVADILISLSKLP